MVVLQTVTSYHFKHSRKKLRKLKKLDTHVLLQRPLCTGYWEFPIPVNSFINAAAFSYRSREVIEHCAKVSRAALCAASTGELFLFFVDLSAYISSLTNLSDSFS